MHPVSHAKSPLAQPSKQLVTLQRRLGKAQRGRVTAQANECHKLPVLEFDNLISVLVAQKADGALTVAYSSLDDVF